MWWIADRIMAGCSDKRIGKRKHREEIPDAFLFSGALKYKKRGGNYHLVTTGGAVCGQVADTVSSSASWSVFFSWVSCMPSSRTTFRPASIPRLATSGTMPADTISPVSCK